MGSSTFNFTFIPQQLSSCRVVSLNNLDGIYNNGLFGVGATLTNQGSFSSLVIDTISVNNGDRILIFGQNNPAYNGVYNVQDKGSNSTPWILLRTDDFQSAAQMQPGTFVTIEDGDNKGSIYVLVSPKPNQIGIDQISFNSFTQVISTSGLYLEKSQNLADLPDRGLALDNLGIPQAFLLYQTNANFTYTNPPPSITYFKFTAPGFDVILPPVNEADDIEVGNYLTIYNIGTESFTLKDSIGDTISVIEPKEFYQFILTDNSFPEGTWLAQSKVVAVNDMKGAVNISNKNTCISATTANLSADYDNGSSGFEATLTNNGVQAALVIDGVTVNVDDRVLVKDQTNQIENGIYKVIDTGSPTTNWVLMRSDDYDGTFNTMISNGDFVAVSNGTTNATTQWMQTQDVTSVGIDNIIFTPFGDDPAIFLKAVNNLSDVQDRVTSAGNLGMPAGFFVYTTALDYSYSNPPQLNGAFLFPSSGFKVFLPKADDPNSIQVGYNVGINNISSSISFEVWDFGGANLIVTVNPNNVYSLLLLDNSTPEGAWGAVPFNLGINNLGGRVYLSGKNTCRLATTSDLGATYNNGTSGFGATLVGSMSALSIDGVAVNLNDRILVKDQSNMFENGIYKVNNPGSVTEFWILERVQDYTSPQTFPSILNSIAPGDLVAVQEGTENEFTLWIQTNVVSTVGVDSIVFLKFFDSAGDYLEVNNNLSDVANRITSTGNLGIPEGYDTVVNGSSDYVFTNPPAARLDASFFAGNAVLLPVANDPNSIQVGKSIKIYNTSINIDFDVEDASSNLIVTMAPGQYYEFILLDNSTSDGTWLARQNVLTVNNQSGQFSLSGKNTCKLATTANLTATYVNNGGIGSTLTNSGVMAALTIDGQATFVGYRILVKDQTSQIENGIYVVTTPGSGAQNWVLTRATDYDGTYLYNIAEGDIVFVSEGTTNEQTGWIQTEVVLLVGSDNIIFNQITDNPLTLPLSMANGGTNKALTASNGGLVYTDADSMEILAGTATAGQIPRSGSNSAPTWSTATYPATTTVNRILYSSATNTVTDLATSNSAMLSTNSSGVPAWSASMTDGQIMIGDTSGTPSPATLTAGSGISIVNGANSITISNTSSIISWNIVTGTTTMVANNGYITNNTVQVSLNMPATGDVSEGDILRVSGKGTGGWKIVCSGAQNIHFGTAQSGTGVGVGLESTQQFDAVELLCIDKTGGSTVWNVLSSVGNVQVND